MNCRSLLTVLALLGLLLCSPARAADRLLLLEGQEAAGDVTSIDETGKLGGAGLSAGLTLDGLRKIERSVEAVAGKPTIILELANGGRIQATSATVADEKFNIKWPHGADFSLKLEDVRAMRLKPVVRDDGFEAALVKSSADNDRVFVDIEGKPTMLVGLMESLAADKIVFQYEGASRTMPLDRLYGIVFAEIGGAAAKPASGVTAELADGSKVAGTVKSLADGKLEMLVGKSPVVVPWAAVRSVSIRSARLAFLSDLTPAKVDERRLVTLPAAWQVDRNVNKGTLAIGARKFDRGLGVHAYSQLVFDIGGSYNVFAAVIGIDAAAERKGDCVFVVLGDGRELLRQRKTGSDMPQEIKIDVSGVKELSLVVEPGADLDLADLADWADARVIK